MLGSRSDRRNGLRKREMGDDPEKGLRCKCSAGGSVDVVSHYAWLFCLVLSIEPSGVSPRLRSRRG